MGNLKNSTSTVILDFYDDQYKPGLSHYHLNNEQMNYSALPMKSIKECEQDVERHPIVILYGHKPAGFFVFHEWGGVKRYSENRKALLLRSFSVNSVFQGMGIASKALFLLDSFVKKHFPDMNEVILAVNHKNIIAQHVYKKSGYIDSGKRAMGKHGEMFILSKTLS
jgi:Acetyltransferases, including N-acetylases of ribosomal proteins